MSFNELQLEIVIAEAAAKRGGKCIVHFSGDVFFRDEKEEPPGMGSRRAPGKLYGVFSRRMHES